jgi:hypothetical protein
MSHHGHFMERGLSIENDTIVILHLALDNIAEI